MPIDHSIDHARRLVMARVHGILTDPEVFTYKREVWCRPDVAGYDELIDMTDVTRIELPSHQRVINLAELSSDMDVKGSTSKLAIVAPSDLAFGLGRMYQAYRSLESSSTKQVGVFRSREEARAFLGITAQLPSQTQSD